MSKKFINKSSRKRKYLIFSLFLFIFFLGIGYANIEILLNINGSVDVSKYYTYSINYDLNNGQGISTNPISSTANGILEIRKPVKSVTLSFDPNSQGASIKDKNLEDISSTSTDLVFTGWTATGIDTTIAKYGSSRNNVTTLWSDSTTKVGGENDVTYFKSLTSSNNPVTLEANWEERVITLPALEKVGYTCSFNTEPDGSGTAYLSEGEYTITNESSSNTLYVRCVEINYEEYNGNERINIYTNMNDAFNNVTSGNTIKVVKSLNDMSLTNPTVDSNKSIILDLNGNTLTLNKTIINYGNLNIYNSSLVEGILEGSAAFVIDNSGFFTTSTISNTKLSLKNSSTLSSARVLINRLGTSTLNENTYLSFTQGTDNYRYVVSTNGILNIDGANIINKNVSSSAKFDRGLQINHSDGKIVISSGIIETSGSSVIASDVEAGNTTNVCVDISGGTISSMVETAIINDHSKNEILIRGGVITCNESRAVLNNNTGKITINGGLISTNVTEDIATIKNVGGGTLEIKNGNILTTNGSAISNTSGNTIISGGTITSSTTSAHGVGINIKGGEVTMTGGEITASYGIWCSSQLEQAGVLTLGVNDDVINTSIPSITGTSRYGISLGASTFNFYDGVITGPNGSSIHDGIALNTPTGYAVKKTISNSQEVATLSNSYTITLDQESGSGGTTSVTATYGSEMPSITIPTQTYTITLNPNFSGSSTRDLTSNYTFNGYFDGEDAQYYNNDGTSARTWNKTTNATLYADWTPQSIQLLNFNRTNYILLGWYDDPTAGNRIGGAGSSITPTEDMTLYAHWQSKCVYFSSDSWSTIISNLNSGNTSRYVVGCNKQIDMGTTFGTHTVKIVNNSNYNCSLSSKTACGFVLEFTDIITTYNMNTTATNSGGWGNSALRSYLNSTIYNALPTELKNNIINTTVAYNNGSTVKTDISDKLYLSAAVEIGGTIQANDYITSSYTRNYDYYSGTNNSSLRVRKYNNTNTAWWTRAANAEGNNHFIAVSPSGSIGTWIATYSNGVVPAFRLKG